MPTSPTCPAPGLLAATSGTTALRTWFERNAEQLSESPQQAMGDAFAYAHEEVRKALIAKYDALGKSLAVSADGLLLEQDGQPVDGGTTATVVALLQGHLLVVANVGDSDCLLGGRLDDGSIGFEQLCADHSPMSVDEYLRVRYKLCLAATAIFLRSVRASFRLLSSRRARETIGNLRCSHTTAMETTSWRYFLCLIRDRSRSTRSWRGGSMS